MLSSLDRVLSEVWTVCWIWSHCPSIDCHIDRLQLGLAFCTTLKSYFSTLIPFNIPKRDYIIRDFHCWSYHFSSSLYTKSKCCFGEGYVGTSFYSLFLKIFPGGMALFLKDIIHHYIQVRGRRGISNSPNIYQFL